MGSTIKSIFVTIIALSFAFSLSIYMDSKRKKEKNNNQTVYKLKRKNYYYVTTAWKSTVTITPLPNDSLYEKVEFSGVIKTGNEEINNGDIVEIGEWYQIKEAFWNKKHPRQMDIEYTLQDVYVAKLVHERFPKDTSLDAPAVRTQWSESGQKAARKFSKISAPIVWSYGINGDGVYASVLVFTNDFTGESYHLVKAEENGKNFEKIFLVEEENLFKKLDDYSLRTENYYQKDSKTKEWDYVDKSGYHGGF